MITSLDHLNIRTHQLEVMVDWYERILGFRRGPRPDFPFPGAWMYCGGLPLVHLVGVEDEPGCCADDLKLEHGAFGARGLKTFVAALEAAGERHRIGHVPGTSIVQVNVWDPDGNHLHIDFNSDEAES